MGKLPRRRHGKNSYTIHWRTSMIYIASDHGGYKLKETIKAHLPKSFEDVGPDTDASCDYPLFAQKACE
ncbi:RpiB/LacA/LacB family sugar-phosphate isomerase, partial [Treponema sp. R6D11]